MNAYIIMDGKTVRLGEKIDCTGYKIIMAECKYGRCKNCSLDCYVSNGMFLCKDLDLQVQGVFIEDSIMQSAYINREFICGLVSSEKVNIEIFNETYTVNKDSIEDLMSTLKNKYSNELMCKIVRKKLIIQDKISGETISIQELKGENEVTVIKTSSNIW